MPARVRGSHTHFASARLRVGAQVPVAASAPRRHVGAPGRGHGDAPSNRGGPGRMKPFSPHPWRTRRAWSRGPALRLRSAGTEPSPKLAGDDDGTEPQGSAAGPTTQASGNQAVPPPVGASTPFAQEGADDLGPAALARDAPAALARDAPGRELRLGNPPAPTSLLESTTANLESIVTSAAQISDLSTGGDGVEPDGSEAGTTTRPGGNEAMPHAIGTSTPATTAQAHEHAHATTLPAVLLAYASRSPSRVVVETWSPERGVVHSCSAAQLARYMLCAARW